jgi:hypothetical protein
MSQNSLSSEEIVKGIRRATRKRYSAEEKIRIVLDSLRGEHSIAELCRPEGVAEGRVPGSRQATSNLHPLYPQRADEIAAARKSFRNPFTRAYIVSPAANFGRPGTEPPK